LPGYEVLNSERACFHSTLNTVKLQENVIFHDDSHKSSHPKLILCGSTYPKKNLSLKIGNRYQRHSNFLLCLTQA